MPPPQVPTRLMPSIIDRLCDPESMGAGSTAGYDHRQMLVSVRADLEELLNTRQTVLDVPPEMEEVQKSIVTYGLPDLAKFNGSPDHCALLAKSIVEVVNRCEPRLRRVKVKVMANKGDIRSVRFHIEAELNVDPAPEVGFETVLELTTGRALVKTDEGLV